MHQLYNTIPQLTCVCNITHFLVVECELNCDGQQEDKTLIPSPLVTYSRTFDGGVWLVDRGRGGYLHRVVGCC